MDTRKLAQNLMGQVVTVKAEIKEEYQGQHPNCRRCLVRVPVKERAGWVVGLRWLREGLVRTQANYDPVRPWRGIDEGTYLDVTQTIPTLLVTFWPTMKPVYVSLEDGWELGGEPYPPNASPEERQGARDAYVRNKGLYPRDRKGRFVA